MALQEILQKILDEAAGVVSEIESETENKKKALCVASQAQEKLEQEQWTAKMDRAVETLETKTRTMARREQSRKLLTVKQEVLDQALSGLEQSLKALDDTAYGSLLDKLFAPFAQDSGKIFVSKDRLAVTQKHAPKGCDVIEDDTISGGFRAKIGGAGIDNSLQNLLFSEHKLSLVTYLADSLNLV